MRKAMAMVVGLVLVSAVAAYASCGSCGRAAASSTNQASCKAAGVYVCTMCKIGATQAGKCTKCGMNLAKMRVLACADGTVSLCSCSTDCKCTLNDAGAKCSCGKDVVKLAMKDIPGCGSCKTAVPAPAAPSAEAR